MPAYPAKAVFIIEGISEDLASGVTDTLWEIEYILALLKKYKPLLSL
jgi:hypothetical protein